MYFEAVSSPTYTNLQFEQALSSKNLYRLCGIEYKGRGRPRSVRRSNTVKRIENEQSKQRSCAALDGLLVCTSKIQGEGVL